MSYIFFYNQPLLGGHLYQADRNTKIDVILAIFYCFKPLFSGHLNKFLVNGFVTVRGWEVTGQVFSLGLIFILNEIFNTDFLALDKKIRAFLKGLKFS